jgi:NitT/TauT family transport system ATP-binding protein
VLRTIIVPFARPRREGMKLEPAFLELRREISELLRQDIKS